MTDKSYTYNTIFIFVSKLRNIRFLRIFIFLLTLNISFSSASQIKLNLDSLIKVQKEKGYVVRGKIIDGDTAMHVRLRQIIIRPPFKFKSRRQRRRYSRLVRYVKKVYPYSKIVSKQLYEIHRDLGNYETKKGKKNFIKYKEKELTKQFEGKLRKLTYTQGRILIKLIDRETGYTTYQIVKELKGSLNAFFWQSVARIFGSNLKMQYDAKGDDIMIEDIVIRIENGML